MTDMPSDFAPRCDYTVKVTIVKEVTIEGYPDQTVDELMDKVIDAVHDDLSEDDVTDAEITDALLMD